MVNVLLYSAEIWSPPYTEIVERAQVRFIKLLLSLPRSTPDFYVRLESGRIHLKFNVFKRLLGWWRKLLAMGNDRLPRMCYDRLLQLSDSKKMPFNWVTEFSTYLFEIGAQDVWLAQDLKLLCDNYSSLIEACRNNLLCKDISKAETSHYNMYFRNISTLGLGEEYLTYNIHINKLRIFCQLRLMGKKVNRLFYNGTAYKFSPESSCPLCNSGSLDSLEHFVSIFPNMLVASWM